MAYEDKIMDALEERIPFEDIEAYGENIDELIAFEESKGEDKMRPEVLAETIAGYILSGEWNECSEDMGSGIWDDDDDFEMNQSYCL